MDIQNFVNLVQQDVVDLIKFAAKTNQAQPREEKAKEIALTILSGIRIASAGLMANGVLWGVSVIPYALTSPVSSVISVAIAACIFALGHDVFVLAKNHSDLILDQRIGNIFAGFANEAVNFFTVARYQFGNGMNQVRTEGTFLQVIWTNTFTAMRA